MLASIPSPRMQKVL